MWTVIIGKTAGKLQVAFIVERCVQRSVATRSSVSRFRVSVGTLEVPSRPSARECGLEGVIVRVSIVRKQLHAAVPVNTFKRRTRNSVGESLDSSQAR